MGHFFRCVFLSCFLIVTTITVMVRGTEEDTQGNHHHQFQDSDVEIRLKRDVLKGKNHDLTRSKRYIGRVPVAYMKKGLQNIDLEPYDQDEDDIISGSQKQSPPLSHFREFQSRQGVNYNLPQHTNELRVEEPRALPSAGVGLLKPHRNQRRYIPNINAVPKPDDNVASSLSDLSEQDIQSLLLMLDGYELNEQNNEQKNPRVQSIRPEQYYSYLSPLDLERVAQMYAVGKRETGKRSKNYEQPMSFDNALYPGGDRLEFINEKRSKRIGARNLMAMKTTSNRVKKETDPAVLATLERVFTQPNPEKASSSNAKNPSSISSPNALSQEQMVAGKSKKSIDWSNYLGIDKRTNEKAILKGDAQDEGEKGGIEKGTISGHINPSSSATTTNIKSTQISSASSPSSSKNLSILENKAKVKQTNDKKLQERKENETENKDDDRNWILQEFYKNFAMSTNVKRKRESPSLKAKSDLEKLEDLEKKMAQAGDKIIWDTLKYTGAHRDEKLSPIQLAQVKSNVIQKLSTAYSLEKVREALDELREEISTLEDRQKSKD